MLATRTPLVIEDVRSDPRFASDVAEDTGYVPKGLMAAPLLHEEGALGVLSVLDRPEQTLFSLQEMELLGLFANQAAIAVDLLLKARTAERLLGDGGGELEVVARLATAVDALEDEQREAGLRLLGSPGADARRDRHERKKRPGRLYIPPGPRNFGVADAYSRDSATLDRALSVHGTLGLERLGVRGPRRRARRAVARRPFEALPRRVVRSWPRAARPLGALGRGPRPRPRPACSRRTLLLLFDGRSSRVPIN